MCTVLVVILRPSSRILHATSVAVAEVHNYVTVCCMYFVTFFVCHPEVTFTWFRAASDQVLARTCEIEKKHSCKVY